MGVFRNISAIFMYDFRDKIKLCSKYTQLQFHNISEKCFYFKNPKHSVSVVPFLSIKNERKSVLLPQNPIIAWRNHIRNGWLCQFIPVYTHLSPSIHVRSCRIIPVGVLTIMGSILKMGKKITAIGVIIPLRFIFVPISMGVRHPIYDAKEKRKMI